MGLISGVDIQRENIPVKKVVSVPLCIVCKAKPVLFGSNVCSEVCRNSHYANTFNGRDNILAEYTRSKE